MYTLNTSATCNETNSGGCSGLPCFELIVNFEIGLIDTRLYCLYYVCEQSYHSSWLQSMASVEEGVAFHSPVQSIRHIQWHHRGMRWHELNSNWSELKWIQMNWKCGFCTWLAVVLYVFDRKGWYWHSFTFIVMFSRCHSRSLSFSRRVWQSTYRCRKPGSGNTKSCQIERIHTWLFQQQVVSFWVVSPSYRIPTQMQCLLQPLTLKVMIQKLGISAREMSRWKYTLGDCVQI